MNVAIGIVGLALLAVALWRGWRSAGRRRPEGTGLFVPQSWIDRNRRDASR